MSTTLLASPLNWKLVESVDSVYHGKVLSFKADYNGRFSKKTIELEFNCNYENIYRRKQVLKLGSAITHYALSDDLNFRIAGSDIEGFEKIKAAITSNYIAVYFNGDLEHKLPVNSIMPVLNKYSSKVKSCEDGYDQSFKIEQDTINNREIQQQRWEEERERKNLFTFGAFAVGAIIALWMLKLLVNKASRWSKNKANSVKTKLVDAAIQRENDALQRKIVETAIDETVRESIRQRHNKITLAPNDVLQCPTCKGAGCSSCNNRGWVLKD